MTNIDAFTVTAIVARRVDDSIRWLAQHGATLDWATADEIGEEGMDWLRALGLRITTDDQGVVLTPRDIVAAVRTLMPECSDSRDDEGRRWIWAPTEAREPTLDALCWLRYAGVTDGFAIYEVR